MGIDENGQPVTTNLGEYLLITAPEVPVIASWPDLFRPSTTYPLSASPSLDARNKCGHDGFGQLLLKECA